MRNRFREGMGMVIPRLISVETFLKRTVRASKTLLAPTPAVAPMNDAVPARASLDCCKLKLNRVVRARSVRVVSLMLQSWY